MRAFKKLFEKDPRRKKKGIVGENVFDPFDTSPKLPSTELGTGSAGSAQDRFSEWYPSPGRKTGKHQPRVNSNF